MSRLDHYLEYGASLAAYGDGALLADHPALIAWQDGYLAFWWLEDDRPHVFAIENKREHGDEVRMEHAGGSLSLTPLPVYDKAKMKAWKTWLKDYRSMIKASLRQEIEGAQAGKRPEPEMGPERAYRVMLHYMPDSVSPDSREGWVLAGVWAADEETIAYWGNPALVYMTQFWRDTIQQGLENGGTPNGIFDYWLGASEMSSRRTLYAEAFKATSAGAAAAMAYRAAVG